MNETYESYFGLWWTAIAWVVLLGALLLFVPFYRKADRKPAGAFLAFVTAFAVEMFGMPLSLYFVMWAFGKSLPFGVFWGRTFSGSIGMTGHYIFLASILTGGFLIVAGWARIYREYWSKEDGSGLLVGEGIYRYIRHPQYAGFLLIALGALCEWATITLLILWPVLAVLYYRLARSEERDLERAFGSQWREYAERTGMFFPRMFR